MEIKIIIKTNKEESYTLTKDWFKKDWDKVEIKIVNNEGSE